MMSVLSEVTSRIGMHNSRALNALHNCVSGGPAWISGSSRSSSNHLEGPASRAATLNSIQQEPPTDTAHYTRLRTLSAQSTFPSSAHTHTASAPIAPDASSSSNSQKYPLPKLNNTGSRSSNSVHARHSGSNSMSSSGGLKDFAMELRGSEPGGPGQHDPNGAHTSDVMFVVPAAGEGKRASWQRSTSVPAASGVSA